jgi:hypothetical protein
VDDLSALLHAASDNAPPTAIDLDGLIAGERQRRRRSRLTVAAAASGVVAIATVAVFLGNRPPGTVPLPAAPAPMPGVSGWAPDDKPA